jgi:hypothetical protein
LCNDTFAPHLPLQGLLAIDEAPFEYLLALMGTDKQLLEAKLDSTTTSSSTSSSSGIPPAGFHFSNSTNSSGNGSLAAGGAGGRGGAAAGVALPDGEVIAALVLQVKEVLPDYGDGFITACLYYTDFKPEQVGFCWGSGWGFAEAVGEVLLRLCMGFSWAGRKGFAGAMCRVMLGLCAGFCWGFV